MKLIRGLFLGAGLIIGIAAESSAQFPAEMAPFAGRGATYGYPAYGTSSGYSNFSSYGPGLSYSSNMQTYSSTGYLSGPGVIGGQFGYRSGYSGLGAVNSYGYRSQPYYGAYGYGFSSSGSTDGFAPFRSLNRFRRYR